MDFLKLISDCLGLDRAACVSSESNYGGLRNTSKQTEIDSAVDHFMEILYDAEKMDTDLRLKLENCMIPPPYPPSSTSFSSSSSWTEALAKAILTRLANAIKMGVSMSAALKEEFDKVVHEAAEFAKEHPEFCVLIALGVLVLVAPWVIEAVGFAEFGPIGGSWAALWQSRYAGFVPKGSLFSFFQRLGMKWHY